MGQSSQHPVTRLLRSRWLQGVGAVAGVAAVGLTVLYAQGGDDGATSMSQQGTANVGIQDGSNNCVNCQFQQPSASPSPPLNPLAINATWPTLRGCDGATEVAVFSGGPDPRTLRLVKNEDVRTRLSAEGGAAFGPGFLELSLTVTDGSTVEITNIKPVIFRRLADQPEWVWNPEGGCGDSYSRVFDLDLDRPSLTDRGLVGDEATNSDDDIPPATAPLGSTFHVSQQDPASVEILAHACSSTYEWGVEVTSVVRGEQRTTQIGTPAQPFRSIGTLTAAVPAYGYDMNATDRIKRTGQQQRPPNCT
jgi:hypothetical protein